MFTTFTALMTKNTTFKPTCCRYSGCEETEHLIKLSCDHLMCAPCLKHHAINELQAGRREVVCPTMVHDTIIEDAIVKTVLRK